VDDENAYALEVTGDSMQPLYRNGDILIVSPNSAARKATAWRCARPKAR